MLHSLKPKLVIAASSLTVKGETVPAVLTGASLTALTVIAMVSLDGVYTTIRCATTIGDRITKAAGTIRIRCCYKFHALNLSECVIGASGNNRCAIG